MEHDRWQRGWARGLRWAPRVAWVAALAVAVGLAWSDRAPWVRNNHDVGHADEAAYALQARGLALHGSSKVPYVSVFFRRYDPGIWRHDDHWPPLLGWVLAPFFRWRGVDAAVGRSVCVGLGALALPLASALLAWVACRRGWAAWLAAVAVLADSLILGESLRMLSDVLMTTLLVGFAAAVIAGNRVPRWYWAAGACAAAATLAKGSQLLLLGLLPCGALALGGVRALRRRHLWLGVVLGVALLLPWWTTMQREYGSPFHSTQNHVSAFYGLVDDWDEGFYRVHWDQAPPTLRDRFADLPAWRRATRRNAEVYLRATLLGDDATGADWPALGAFGRWVRRTLSGGVEFGAWRPSQRLRTWRIAWHGLGLAWGVAAVFAWPLVTLTRWIRGRGARPAAACEDLGIAAFLGFLVIEQAAFVVFLWSADQMRFTLALTPLVAVLGLHAVALVVRAAVRVGLSVSRRIGGKLPRTPGLARVAVAVRLVRAYGVPAASVLVALVAAAAALRWHRPLLDWQACRLGFEVPDEPRWPRYHAVAQSLAEAGVGTEAVVMTRNPWELLFYTPVGMRGIGLPYASPEQIFAVARTYGVTHFVHDCERSGLWQFLREHPAAFRRVARRPYPVYEIDWGALPDAPGTPARAGG